MKCKMGLTGVVRSGAIAMVAMLAAPAAMALTPDNGSFSSGGTASTVPADGSNDMILLSGASGSAPMAWRGYAVSDCVPGSIDVFSAGTLDEDPKTAVFCTSKAGDRIKPVTGTTRTVFNMSMANSASGITPIVLGTALEFLDLGDAGFSCASSTSVTEADGFQYWKHEDCGPATLSAAPEIGLSSVEPARFSLGLSRAQSETLDQQRTADVIYGVQANKRLYQILQANQFAETSRCHPNHADYSAEYPVDETTGAASPGYSYGDSLACKPSLTRQQLRSLFSETSDAAAFGGSQGYDAANFGLGSPGEFQFGGFYGNTAGTYLSYQDSVGNTVSCGGTPSSDWTGAGGSGSLPASALGLDLSNHVFVCARTADSGVQAAAEMYLTQQRCGGDAQTSFCRQNSTFNSDVAAGASTALETLSDYAGSSSFRSARCHFSQTQAGVAGCLDAHQQAASCAVGIAATSQKRATSTDELTGNYRFVKIDGKAPTAINVQNGRYEFWASQAVISSQGASSFVKELAANFAEKFNSPTSARTAMKSPNCALYGQDGCMLAGPYPTVIPIIAPFSADQHIDDPATLFDEAALSLRTPPSSPVNSAWRSYAVLPDDVNNCLPPLQIYQQQVGEGNF
ncbi:MAG: hypothetical protein KDK91_22680 [Gammaproteobacteria bacterium]|nr:hypothetical protein [Gammaproteobacteria bacterium]